VQKSEQMITKSCKLGVFAVLGRVGGCGLVVLHDVSLVRGNDSVVQWFSASVSYYCTLMERSWVRDWVRQLVAY